MSDFLDVRIARRREEAEGIISLELVDPAGGCLPAFEAGAHVEVQIAPGLSRHYSLCGSPEDLRSYRLGILREPASRGGSAQIHQMFLPDTLIRISLPRNQFHLDESATHSVLVGGCIGVTPILAMAWRLHALGKSFELHYCVRSRTRAAFIGQLAQSPFADQITLHVDEDGQPLDIAALLKGPEGQRHLYVCGPGGFMQAVIGEGRRQGWAAQNIHSEYFAAEVDPTGSGFTLYAARSGQTLQVLQDQSIAQVLIEAGIDVPLSCEQGVCGTCLTPVLEGIPDHRDLFLTDREKTANDQMLVCCSRSNSAFLRLDI